MSRFTARVAVLALVAAGLSAAVASPAIAAKKPKLPPNCVATNKTLVTCTFNYNGTDGVDGSAQTFTVPPKVTAIRIDAYGAQGADVAGAAGPHGGLGGHEGGLIGATPGQVLEVRVGGQPTSFLGGFNGGGRDDDSGGPDGTDVAGSGGGASDVRPAGGALADRIVTAGGGGGHGSFSGTGPAGGAGGGVNGGMACAGAIFWCAQGGSDVAGGAGGKPGACIGGGGLPGTFGVGGWGGACVTDELETPVYGAGGGGGGWYGGGGGGIDPYDSNGARWQSGGGGGSGHISVFSLDTVQDLGVRAGHGMVTIAYNRKPVPPLGGVSCTTNGAFTISPGLTNAASTLPVTMKITATGNSCIPGRQVGGKASVTDVSLQEIVTLAPGSTCQSFNFAAGKPVKLRVRWRHRNSKNGLSTVASSSVTGGTFAPFSPAIYQSMSTTIAKPARAAFLHRQLGALYFITDDATQQSTACQSPTGLTTLHFTGLIAST